MCRVRGVLKGHFVTEGGNDKPDLRPRFYGGNSIKGGSSLIPSQGFRRVRDSYPPSTLGPPTSSGKWTPGRDVRTRGTNGRHEGSRTGYEVDGQNRIPSVLGRRKDPGRPEEPGTVGRRKGFPTECSPVPVPPPGVRTPLTRKGTFWNFYG